MSGHRPESLSQVKGDANLLLKKTQDLEAEGKFCGAILNSSMRLDGAQAQIRED